MIDTNALKGAMIAAGYKNVKEAAEAVGMPAMTMYRRLAKGEFDNKQIEAMTKAYKITDPMRIFFADMMN